MLCVWIKQLFFSIKKSIMKKNVRVAFDEYSVTERDVVGERKKEISAVSRRVRYKTEYPGTR